MQVKKWLITLFICIAILVALGVTKFTQIQAAIAFSESFPESSETVNVTPVKTLNWQSSYTVSGLIKPVQKVSLISEFPGNVTAISGDSGERVRQGKQTSSETDSLTHLDTNGTLS